MPLVNLDRPLACAITSNSLKILKLPHKREPNIPSVSKVLSATMSEQSKMALLQWEKHQIAMLGLEGFQKMKSDTFARGHRLHKILENYLETKQLPLVSHVTDSITQKHIISISELVKKLENPLLLESAVKHPELNYCGIVDSVLKIGDTIALVDWKTSERVKKTRASLYDAPIQVAAYIGALNSDPRYQELGSICNGAVVVIYNSGLPADVHLYSKRQMQGFWGHWCKRLRKYKDMNQLQ